MALECSRRIDFLQNQCDQLGITVTPAGRKLMKDDYVKALRNHFIIEKYGSLDNVPWDLKFMLSIECPQLCRRIKDLKPEQQEMVWESQDWIAEEKIDGCFTYDTPIMLEDGTTLPIGKIVEEKLSVNVLSLNITTGKIESKPVVNWFNNGYKQMNEWCHLSRNRGQQRVLGTENIQQRFITKNHKVWNGFDWIESVNCDEAYGISYWLNDIQKQVLHGMLLGDSTFVKDSRYKESYKVMFFHSEKQKDYFDKKANLFNKFNNKIVDYISGYGKLCYKTGFSNPYLKYAYNLIGDRKSNISYEFLNSITPLTLAIWYLDDGSRAKGYDELNITNKYSRANFSVFRYDENVVDLLVNKLNEFGYQASKRFAKRDNGFLICLNSEGSQKFFNDIAKYIPSSMSYKLPSNLRHLCDTFDWWNMNDIEYNSVKVKTNVSKTNSTSHKKLRAYDIEVADNHNYIANGFIVHNCRMLTLYNADEKKFHFYSRNNSVEDYLPQDYSDTIYVTSKDFDYPHNFVLDCEIISTNSEVETNTQCLTQLQSTAALLNLNAEDSKRIQKNNPLKFVVFDCLFDKESLINSPWTERHKHALKLENMLRTKGFCCEINPVVEATDKYPEAKRDFFDRLIANDKEGVVLKNRNAKYHATSSRTIDCVKVKRSTSDTLTKDLDAFVTDYVVGKDDTRNANMIVGFVFSIKMEKQNGEIVTHPIGVCSNVSDFIKEDATAYDKHGNVTLNKNYYFKVATLQGQNISARNLRLTHAVINCWRPEKSSDGCEIIKESELRSLIF
jgi:predicted nucleic-acid-binding protein